MAKESFIKRLPGYLQTPVNKKFFKATVDQLLSPRNSEKVLGYIGRRQGGFFSPETDYYIEEPTNSRLNYQLEPISVVQNPQTAENDNEVFYENFLNRLRFYGSNISNHDRLFESEYYSFAPPIDVDKFLNYSNYIWIIKDDLPNLQIIYNNVVVAGTGQVSQAFHSNIVDGTFNFITLGVQIGHILVVQGTTEVHTITNVTNDTITVSGSFSTPLSVNTYDYRVEKPGLNDSEIETNLLGNVAFTTGAVAVDSTLTQSDINGDIVVINYSSTNSNHIQAIINLTKNYFYTIDQYTIDINYKTLTFYNSQLQLHNPNSILSVGDDIRIIYDTIPLSSGMPVSFPQSTNYKDVRRIEQVGISIVLVPFQTEILPVDQFIFNTWDASNDPWDSLTWDVTFTELGKDYITIQRGACDHNAWSRTNSWYHKDIINTIVQYEGLNFFPSSQKAIRPIIEFKKDIELYGSGQKWFQDVTVASEPNFESVFGAPNGTAIDDIVLENGQTLIFLTNSEAFKFNPWDEQLFDSVEWDAVSLGEISTHFVWKVTITPNNVIDLIQNPNDFTPVNDGDLVIIQEGKKYSGDTFYSQDNEWILIKNQKIKANQNPLFSLYDHDAVLLDDPVLYPFSNFKGSPIFSYTQNKNSISNDSELGFPLTYKSLGQVSDIVFTNDLQNQYTFGLGNATIRLPIEGYYFFKNFNADTECAYTPSYENEWLIASRSFKQKVIDRYIIIDITDVQYELSVLPELNNNVPDVQVFIDGNLQILGTGYTVTNKFINLLTTLKLNQVLEIYTYSTEKSVESFIVPTSKSQNFHLAKTPLYTPVVTINSIATTNFTFKNRYLMLQVKLNPGQVVNVKYTSKDNLPATARGYYEIPATLEKNPTNQEIVQQSYNDFVPHFLSILENQPGITNAALGASNNYRDTIKDLSLGEFILQNKSSLLKSMFATSSDKINLISSMRFASREYIRFKNKFLRIANEMRVKNQFGSIFDANNDISKDVWLNAIIKKINQSSEVKSTFLYSSMMAIGTVFVEQNLIPKPAIDVYHGLSFSILQNFILDDPSAFVYVYKINNLLPTNDPNREDMLLIDEDYTLSQTSINDPIMINLLPQISSLLDGTTSYSIVVRTYINPPTVNLPATPSKLGMFPVYRPKIDTDHTYITPGHPTGQTFIYGHDGSKTPIFGDIRDTLLLEFEKRIYNNICAKFRNQDYVPPLLLQDVFPGKFRDTNFTTNEYNEVSQGTFTKWANFNKVNFRNNTNLFGGEILAISQLGSITNGGNQLNDTSITFTGIQATIGDYLIIIDNVVDQNELAVYTIQTLNTHSVVINETFNFTSSTVIYRVRAKGDVWTYNYTKYGTEDENLPAYWKGIFNFYYDTTTPNVTPWEMLGFSIMPDWWTLEYGFSPYTSSNAMWNDIAAGRILHGDREGIDSRFVRINLVSDYLPVDISGNLKDPVSIGLVNAIINSTDAERNWQYGDGAPGEDAWKVSSSYPFAAVEILYLTKPAKFSDLFWNTYDLVNTIANTDQIVSRKTFKRVQNSNILVHGEVSNNKTVINYGYQQYISDSLTFLGLSIPNEFGNKIRTLDVKLGHKLAGYTNPVNNKIIFEALSPNSTSMNNIVPQENTNYKIFTGPSVKEFVYSGVVIRTTEEGTYELIGYDLLSSTFKMYSALPNASGVTINVSGKSATFTNFQFSQTYKKGDIVRYNGIYYSSLSDQFTTIFDTNKWEKLSALPVNGGLNVVYFAARDKSNIIEVPYGTVLTTIQDVFDFMVGYGSYLESQGWIFDQVNASAASVSNFFEAGKQFIFWVSEAWGSNKTISLSPLAAKIKIKVDQGYPSSVEMTTNDVYSLLDQNGVLVDPRLVFINRDDQHLEIIPKNNLVKLYYSRINSQESEHIIVLDNFTEFNDTVFDSLLCSRQLRVKFSGFRSLNWFGKYEAAGYVITPDNKLIPNLENTTNSMRYYHSNTYDIDNLSAEQVARHLIGFQESDYLVNLDLSNDTQYLFYQGLIREKGTEESLTKLLRSSYIREDQNLNIFEEWAIKLHSYGASSENKRIDVVLFPNDVKTEPQLILLNTPESQTGVVGSITIINAETIWTDIPNIYISRDPNDPGTGSDAQAIATLNSNNTLKEIVLTNSGSGYYLAPFIYIGEGHWDADPYDFYPFELGTNDKAITTLIRDIIPNPSNSDIVIIDVDDNSRWISKPRDCSSRDLWPVTDNIKYQMPNAGYVHPADVFYQVFNIPSLPNLWSNTSPSIPTEHDTIWVAETKDKNDWNVYRLLDFDLNYTLVNRGSLQLKLQEPIPTLDNSTRVLSGYLVIDEFGFGTTSEIKSSIFSYTFNGYQLTSVPLTENVDGEDFRYVYTLTNIDGTTPSVKIANDLQGDSLLLFVSMRFEDQDQVSIWHQFVEQYLQTHMCFKPNDLIWLDNDGYGKWIVKQAQEDPLQKPWDNGIWDCGLWDGGKVNDFIPYRKQGKLIESSKFKQAFLYEYDTGKTIDLLTIYDPFKGIIPGTADRNITYRVQRDPARYFASNDPTLIDPNNMFGEHQIGQVWWDTSTIRYYYYEQGTPRERRDYWGILFPGSTVTVYEWTRSLNPPAQYTGDGTVRNITDFCQFFEYDPLIEKNLNVYYFWVSNTSTIPDNLPNRNLSTISIANLITNPRKQDYKWFAAVDYDNDNSVVFELNRASPVNSLIINNVNSEIVNQTSALQINYKYTSDDMPVHTEWYLIREGDSSSIIKDQHWNKMEDSIVGTTAEIAWDWSNPVPGFLPTVDGFGYLMVPDPQLSDAEKIGTEYRPRQSWFSDIDTARKIFVRKVNTLLALISLDDTRPGWFKQLPSYISNSDFYQLHTYINWYAPGWTQTTAIPIKQVQDTADLIDIQSSLNNNDIIKVVNGYRFSLDGSFKYVLYVYTSETQTFSIICKEDATIILDEILVAKCSTIVGYRQEFRGLIDALKTNIFIEDLLVNTNLLFFTMLRYAASTDLNIDWTFKTSYIKITQSGLDLSQSKFFEIDPFESILGYINSTKPYRTKIRDYSLVRDAGIDSATGTALELRNMKIDLVYNRTACGAWDYFTWDNDTKTWDNELHDVRGWGCNNEDVIRDARTFIQPTYPWDTTSNLWDNNIWDGNLDVSYLDGANLSNINLFADIDPDQTVSYNGINTIILDFTPLFEDEGPTVLINGNYTRNFEYNKFSTTFVGTLQSSYTLAGVRAYNGSLEVTVNLVAYTQVGSNPVGNQYTIAFDVNGTAVITFSSIIYGNQIVNVSYNFIRLFEYNTITNGSIISIYNIAPMDGLGFLQPQWKEGIPEEFVPLDPHETLVITIDSDATLRYQLCPGVIGQGTLAQFKYSTDNSSAITLTTLNTGSGYFGNIVIVCTDVGTGTFEIHATVSAGAVISTTIQHITGTITPNQSNILVQIPIGIVPIPTAGSVYYINDATVDSSTIAVYVNDILVTNIIKTTGYLLWDSSLWSAGVCGQPWDFGTQIIINDDVPTGAIVRFCFNVNYSNLPYSYTLHQDQQGFERMYLNRDAYSAHLATTLKPMDLVIHINNEGSPGLTSAPTLNNPGVIWIDDERIEFGGRTSTTLFSLKRGTHNTTVGIHNVPTRIFDVTVGSLFGEIDHVTTYGDLTSNQLAYARINPGHAILGPCEIEKPFFVGSYVTGSLNNSYSSSLIIEGGASPFTWSIDAGILPVGLVLNNTTGHITGIPTQLGSFAFNIKIIDNNGYEKITFQEIKITL